MEFVSGAREWAAWASVLAICFEPAHAVLARRFGPSRAALLSTLIVTGLIVVPGLVVAGILVAEGSHAASGVQAAFAREGGTTRLRDAWDWARDRVPVLPPVDEVLARVTESMGSLAATVASRAGGVLKNVASFFFVSAESPDSLFDTIAIDSTTVTNSYPDGMP